MCNSDLGSSGIARRAQPDESYLLRLQSEHLFGTHSYEVVKSSATGPSFRHTAEPLCTEDNFCLASAHLLPATVSSFKRTGCSGRFTSSFLAALVARRAQLRALTLAFVYFPALTVILCLHFADTAVIVLRSVRIVSDCCVQLNWAHNGEFGECPTGRATRRSRRSMGSVRARPAR